MGSFRRSSLPDGCFHVIARGVNGSEIFLVDLDRLDFLDLLGRATRRHGLRVIARCLMDTHYHLVVDAPTAKLSATMQQLNSAYAFRFNQRHGRRGHVFSERFRSWSITDEEYLNAALEYVVNNPATAGRRAERNARWTHVDLDQLRS